MANEGFTNADELRGKLDILKKSMNEKSVALNENITQNIVDVNLPKTSKGYANMIANSLHTKSINVVTEKIKAVDNNAKNYGTQATGENDGYGGKVVRKQPTQQNNQPLYQQQNGGSQVTQQMAESFERNPAMVAEYFKNTGVQLPPQPQIQYDHYGYPIPNQQPIQPPQMQYQQQGQPMNPINENMILGVTNDIMGKYLNENFEKVMQNMLMNSIMETYQTERLKKVLNENSDILEEAVLKILRNIKQKQDNAKK